MTQDMRLNQFIAHAGVCSRRAAEKLILQGAVAVNGAPTTNLAHQVTSQDTVTYRGKPLHLKPYTYLLLNKPLNCLTTRHDPKKRRTVMNLLPPNQQHLYPIGRLDRNTTGLLLLTNDGPLARALSHPSSCIPKTYQVTLKRTPTPQDLAQLLKGVALDDGLAAADQVTPLPHQPYTLQLTLHSGKNRVIRRLFEALHHRVLSLHRISYANLTIKGLPPATTRPLTPEELQQLKGLTAPSSIAPMPRPSLCAAQKAK